MIKLRKAKINESVKILELYNNIIDTANDEFDPKWNDEYINLGFIEDSILKEELYVYKVDERINSSVVVNNDFGKRYTDANWIVDAKPNEIVVIHTFAVNPSCRGRGISK